MKKLRFQVSRNGSRRNRGEPDPKWVIEPPDVALVAAVVLVSLWLQWLLATVAA